MSAPNSHQMRILKLMAAGVELHEPCPPDVQYQLKLKNVVAGVILRATVKKLEAGGWITHYAGDRWVLTDSGRGHAECFTFVRAFSEAPVS